jgi:hypothetical protein
MPFHKYILNFLHCNVFAQKKLVAMTFEVTRVYPGTVPGIGHDHFVPNSFQYSRYPTIQYYITSIMKAQFK